MTVVFESAGTITVVVFAGAGGLLLLIHPDSTGITAINKLARTFIAASLSKAAKSGFILNPELNAAGLTEVPVHIRRFRRRFDGRAPARRRLPVMKASTIPGCAPFRAADLLWQSRRASPVVARPR